MLSSDFLVLVAELAVAIAGFSSVVVALDSRAVKTWSPAQRHNLRVLLQISALTVFFALFALFLERATNGTDFWRWALGVYGVVHLIDAGSFIRRQPTDIPKANKLGPYLGLIVAIGQCVTAAVAGVHMAETIYLASLVFHLAGASMGFGILIFGRSEGGARDHD